MNKLISSGFFLKFLQLRNKQTPQFLRKLLKKLFFKLFFKNNLTSIAYHFQQQGNFNEAESYAVQGVLKYPDSWFSNFIAGVVLFNLNQISQSRSYLEKALSLSPNDSQTIHFLTKTIAIEEGLDIAAKNYKLMSQHCSASSNVLVTKVMSTKSYCSANGIAVIDAGDEEEIPYKDPDVYGKIFTGEFSFVKNEKPFVTEIKNVRVYGNSSILLTDNNVAINDAGGHLLFGKYVNFMYEKIVLAQNSEGLLLNVDGFSVKEIDEAIFLSGLATDQFGHWIQEYLPKLDFLQYHKDFKLLPIIVDSEMPATHYEHLRRLVNNDLIFISRNECIHCKRLILAPPPHFSPVEMFDNDIPASDFPGLSVRALKFVRGDLSQAAQPNKKGRKIFLARKNLKWRKLINEDEITSWLIKQGFEIVYMENLSMTDQIRIFKEASWIVAPNGSAMTNLIFSDIDVKLIVLAQPNLFNWGSFQGPMEAMGYKPLFISGDYAFNEYKKHSDYHVSIKEIDNALTSLGFTYN